ncbi:two-component system histidine kinase PnpS [Planococcus shenhongbingii]|uniref:histidine kinase n=1 Tax=Planococcus shenhongbingii TaxID=3058398 RepID=A0ABT8NDJ5_9BACL|nr:ATP-binding protein [Planococcus sp. N017]MDN7245964.1 ATP-binding protein [Planococcus sp. N017]
MKSFRHRLLTTILIWIGVLLAGLLIVIGQLFPIYAETHNTAEVWLMLFFVFVVAMIFSAIIGYRIIQVQALPVENVTQTALELAKGNYRARAFEYSNVGTVELSSTINILARNLQEITAIREMEQERLKTLIENMGSALIMIDRQGGITLVNRSFMQEFQLAAEDIDGKFYKEIRIPYELERFIEQVFMTETAARNQLEFKQGIHSKHIDVYGAPVLGEHEQWLGIVIVSHDITELKRLEQIRKDFVANVSHELRTPVTSIKGFTETLLEGAYKDPATAFSFLEIIEKESNRLEMLIKDLLELSKVEQAGFRVDAVPTNMKNLIERVGEMVERRLEEKNIQLKLQLEPVIVQGDPNRLVQVMMNLLVNAISYSTSRTAITVRLYQQDGEAVIEVEDQGIGIEASEIGRLFERFYRVDRARSRNSGGTGLGLSIVKHLIEAHHGNVKVESEVGVGTTFTIHLPLAS